MLGKRWLTMYLFGRNVSLLAIFLAETRLPDVQADVRTNDTTERVAVSKITTTTTTTRRARTLQEGIFKCIRSNHYLSLPARREIVRCCSRSHHSPLLSFSLSPPICRRWFRSRRSPLRLRPNTQWLGMCVITRERGLGGEQTLRPRWDTWILDSWMWSRICVTMYLIS